MNIYFSGSIAGGQDDILIYKDMIEYLGKHGTVLTEHIGDAEKTLADSMREPEFIFERDVGWVNQADVIVAEVTQPSLGVGYELGYADLSNKQVLCLFRPKSGKRLSAMVRGNKRFQVFFYDTLEEAKAIFDDFFTPLS